MKNSYLFTARNVYFAGAEKPSTYSESALWERYAKESVVNISPQKVRFDDVDNRGLVEKLMGIYKMEGVADPAKAKKAAMALTARLVMKTKDVLPGFGVNYFKKGDTLEFLPYWKVKINYTPRGKSTPLSVVIDYNIEIPEHAEGVIHETRQALEGERLDVLLEACKREVLYNVVSVLGYRWASATDKQEFWGKLSDLGFDDAKIKKLAPSLKGSAQKNVAACRFIKGLEESVVDGLMKGAAVVEATPVSSEQIAEPPVAVAYAPTEPVPASTASPEEAIRVALESAGAAEAEKDPTKGEYKALLKSQWEAFMSKELSKIKKLYPDVTIDVGTPIGIPFGIRNVTLTKQLPDHTQASVTIFITPRYEVGGKVNRKGYAAGTETGFVTMQAQIVDFDGKTRSETLTEGTVAQVVYRYASLLHEQQLDNTGVVQAPDLRSDSVVMTETREAASNVMFIGLDDEFTEETWKKDIIKASTKQPVVVELYNPDLPASTANAAALDTWAKEHPKVKVIRIEKNVYQYDYIDELATDGTIYFMTFPSMIVVKEGRVAGSSLKTIDAVEKTLEQ